MRKSKIFIRSKKQVCASRISNLRIPLFQFFFKSFFLINSDLNLNENLTQACSLILEVLLDSWVSSSGGFPSMSTRWNLAVLTK